LLLQHPFGSGQILLPAFAQHRVLGAAERVDEKGLQRRFQDGDLRRKGRDQGAAIDIRLLLQAPEQALVEAIDEKTKLGREPFHRSALGLVQRQQ
jgi:hypothetical protein